METIIWQRYVIEIKHGSVVMSCMTPMPRNVRRHNKMLQRYVRKRKLNARPRRITVRNGTNKQITAVARTECRHTARKC